MNESSTITLINLASALIAIVVGIIGIYLFFRNRQFGRPKLEVTFGLRSRLDFPRRLRNKTISLLVIAPKRSLQTPLLTMLIFSLRNSGREAVKNVRISFEYHKNYLVTNQTFRSFADFEPTVVADLPDSNRTSVITPALSEEDVAKIARERQVSVFQDTAQVSLNIEVIRPGETAIVYDLVDLKGSLNEDVPNSDGNGSSHVVTLLRGIQTLLDHVVVNTFIFAENHKGLKNRITVLRFVSEKELDEGLRKFVEALWLGQSPKPGLYFADPVYRWLRRKIWRIGSTQDRRVWREEVGLIRLSKVAQIKTKDALLMKELPEYSEEQCLAVKVPNYDYIKLPPHIQSSEALREWLGLPQNPILKR